MSVHERAGMNPLSIEELDDLKKHCIGTTHGGFPMLFGSTVTRLVEQAYEANRLREAIKNFLAYWYLAENQQQELRAIYGLQAALDGREPEEALGQPMALAELRQKLATAEQQLDRAYNEVDVLEALHDEEFDKRIAAENERDEERQQRLDAEAQLKWAREALDHATEFSYHGNGKYATVCWEGSYTDMWHVRVGYNLLLRKDGETELVPVSPDREQIRAHWEQTRFTLTEAVQAAQRWVEVE